MAKPQTIRLHQDIKADFDKMSAAQDFGVQKYSNEHILHYLAQKYYKSPKTIENIVFGRIELSTGNDCPQLSMFKN